MARPVGGVRLMRTSLQNDLRTLTLRKIERPKWPFDESPFD